MVILFKMDFNGAFLRYIYTNQVERMMKELHDGPDGGHFFARTREMKIMRVGYYCLFSLPSKLLTIKLLLDIKLYVLHCKYDTL